MQKNTQPGLNKCQLYICIQESCTGFPSQRHLLLLLLHTILYTLSQSQSKIQWGFSTESRLVVMEKNTCRELWAYLLQVLQCCRWKQKASVVSLVEGKIWSLVDSFYPHTDPLSQPDTEFVSTQPSPVMLVDVFLFSLSGQGRITAHLLLGVE